MNYTMRVLALVLPGLLAGVLAPVAGAETVAVPPVEISGLVHSYGQASDGAWVTSDSVSFPSGPGSFSGPGFTASIGQGDEVVVRFQAPAGHRFVVRVLPEATQTQLLLNAQWDAGAADSSSGIVAGTVTWYGLQGPAPTRTGGSASISDNGNRVNVLGSFLASANYSFEAVEMRFTVNNAVADVSRTYGSVGAPFTPGFGVIARGPSTLPNTVVMEIAPISVAAPPVEISELLHQHFHDFDTNQWVAWDIVVFPSGPGTFSGPGFTTVIGRGTEIVARFQPPAGHRFVFTVPPDATQASFHFDALWVAGGDITSNLASGTMTWVGLEGAAPTPSFQQCWLSNNGNAFKVSASFAVASNFSFEALEVRFQPTHHVPAISRTYGSVSSNSAPSFAGAASGPSMQNSIVLAIMAPPAPCFGDANGDGLTNGADLSVLLSQFGQSVPNGTDADFNGDGVVDGADLSVLLSNFGCSA